MSGRYSRVYHSILEDPKFVDIYEDDCALATWLRLLIVADQAYPSPALIPQGTCPSGMDKLWDARLVETIGRTRYRVVGLAAEREKRSASASQAASARWQKSDAPAMRPHSAPDAPALLVREGEGEEEGAEKKQPDAPAPAPSDEDDHLDGYYRLTGSWPSRKIQPWLDDLAASHGSGAMLSALALEITADSDRRTLLSRTQARLEKAAHDQRRKREQADKARAVQEREAMAQMPPEQLEANRQRLRAMLADSGFLGGEATDD